MTDGWLLIMTRCHEWTARSRRILPTPTAWRGFIRRCEDAISLTGPAKAVFRPDPGLLLLVTRMPLDPNGQPHVPGDLADVDETIHAANNSKLARDWSKKVGHLNTPEELIEVLCWPFSRATRKRDRCKPIWRSARSTARAAGETP